MNLSALVAALITQTVVPELVAWLKARGQAPIIDDAALAALLVEKCNRDIALGEAFLKAHGIEP
jgi:hypothetical protein